MIRIDTYWYRYCICMYRYVI